MTEVHFFRSVEDTEKELSIRILKKILNCSSCKFHRITLDYVLWISEHLRGLRTTNCT